MPIKVTVWNERKQDRTDERVIKVYPGGISLAIADALNKNADISARTAELAEPECGLSSERLADTDVLIWWGHHAHDEVPDDIAYRVVDAVQRGMGLIVLHSGHMSKPLRLLLGTSCTLKWRCGDRERLWVASPSHPIAAGLPEHFELAQEEMYGEPFDIPNPDETVFMSWFSGGEVFRSGVTYRRGYGKIFYFQPGHETCPTYHDANIQRVILNAVRWAAPSLRRGEADCPNPAPLEGTPGAR